MLRGQRIGQGGQRVGTGGEAASARILSMIGLNADTDSNCAASRKMGDFAISRGVAAVAWIVAGVIVALNVKLLFEAFFG